MSTKLDDLFDRPGLASLPRLFWAGADDRPHQRRGRRLLLLLLVVALAGLAAAGTAFLRGHHVMGTTSEVSWGVLIATYVFFVAATSGLCLVGSLGHVFGFPAFQPIAKKALFLALVTLVVGFSVIAAELERPFLLLGLVIFSPNPASPIWWMGTLYGLYLVIIAVELYLLMREDHRRARVVGIVGVLAAVAAHSNLGAVFALSHSRPFWHGPFVPLYLVVLALVTGAALLALVVYLSDTFAGDGQVRPESVPLLAALRKLLALFLSLAGLFMAWRLIAALYGDHPHTRAVAMAMLAGPLFMSFWLVEVFLGLVVPLAILLGARGRTPGGVALAAALSLASLIVMRLNFVYEGQMLSLRPLGGAMGGTMTYQPGFKGNALGFLPYTPSLVEVLVVAGAVSAATLIYVAGLRVLRLEPARKEEA